VIASKKNLGSFIIISSLREIMLFIGKPMGRSIMISIYKGDEYNIGP